MLTHHDSDQLSVGITDVLDQVALDVPGLTAAVAGERVGAKTVQELRVRLGEAIYRLFHQGNSREQPQSPHTFRDRALEERLKMSIPHESCGVVGRHLDSDGASALVELNHVRVWVPMDRVRFDASTARRGQVMVDLPSYRTALSPGFLFVNGSRVGAVVEESPVLRAYFSLADHSAALAVWTLVLRQLETGGACYRAKVLSAPSFYPRHDALVIYVTDDVWGAIRQLLTIAELDELLVNRVSPFTKRIAPGVAIAWEPLVQRQTARRLSFGQHRARVIADSLIEHGLQSPTGTLNDHVISALREADIDPAEPYRNIGSGPTPADFSTIGV